MNVSIQNQSCPAALDLSNESFCSFFPDDCGPNKPIIKIETGEFIAKLVLYLIIFISSFFGNIMVILVVVLYRSKMQSSAYIYLLNLSVAGLIIALGCMWPTFMVNVAYEYPLGAAMCKIHPFLQLTSMVSSVLTLATIALDQFVAVAFPIHARFTRRLWPSWVISGVWILAAAASIPFLTHKKLTELRFSDHVKLHCSEGTVVYNSRGLIGNTSGK
ncbi:hypothetical protein RvY_08448-2 [Ramazzottius varieornatus]|uniref:G-protein coupled receptors family 1 profile domain-containing protein n=1 Tax=Ramazzottius varieornatus TaxID=947166 RepID=A0A1D1V5Y8_RAMVA|nr:hypothetical protein RvY_08448-2 [Ramazzottius varieornatus]